MAIDMGFYCPTPSAREVAVCTESMEFVRIMGMLPKRQTEAIEQQAKVQEAEPCHSGDQDIKTIATTFAGRHVAGRCCDGVARPCACRRHASNSCPLLTTKYIQTRYTARF